MTIDKEETTRVKDWYKLSDKQFWSLIIYYAILLVIGLIICYNVLLYETLYTNSPLTKVALWGGIGTSVIGCTIFYLRKLYKAAINNRFMAPIDTLEKTRSYGVFLYYFLRPLFAVCFAFLIHISIKSSVAIITVEEPVLDKGFVYLILFVSFFAGFGSGDILTILEKKTIGVLSKNLEQ